MNAHHFCFESLAVPDADGVYGATSRDIRVRLKEQMMRYIKDQDGSVILRSEFADMGSPSNVSRTLQALHEQGVIVRIGTGVYAKTRVSTVTGATVPAGSLESLATEALRKLGIAVAASRAAVDYNDGRTDQLPGRFVVNTGGRRISRKIFVGGRALVYENQHSSRRSKCAS